LIKKKLDKKNCPTKKEKEKDLTIPIAYCFKIKLNKTRGSREALAACHYSYSG
jgi:hypothetical protein